MLYHAGPWKGAGRIEEIRVSPAEAQGEKGVMPDLMRSTHPMVQGLQPGLGVNALSPQAFHTVLGDAGDSDSAEPRQAPARKNLPSNGEAEEYP